MSKQKTSKQGENHLVRPKDLIEISKSGALWRRFIRRSAQLTNLILCKGLIVGVHYAIKIIFRLPILKNLHFNKIIRFTFIKSTNYATNLLI